MCSSIYAVVDSNEALAEMILRTIRYPGHARALSIIEKIDAEMLKIVLPAEHGLTDIPLAELKLPKRVLVTLLGKKEKVIIPNEATRLQAGDHLILFASTSLMREAMELFGGADGERS